MAMMLKIMVRATRVSIVMMLCNVGSEVTRDRIIAMMSHDDDDDHDSDQDLTIK